MHRTTRIQLTGLLLSAAVAAWMCLDTPQGVRRDYGMALLALLSGLVILIDAGKVVVSDASNPLPAVCAAMLAIGALFLGGADTWTLALIGGAGCMVLVALAQLAPQEGPDSLRSRTSLRGPVVPALPSGSAADDVPLVLTYPARTPEVTFDDVIGLDSLKADLWSAGQEIVRGAKSGILLWGAPGTGKTMLAEGLGNALGYPWIAVNVGDLVSRWINQTTEQLQVVFRQAMAQAPCVLFLDEIDSLLVDRAKIGSAESEMTRTVNTLLSSLSAIRGRGVVLVAATNYLSRLDSAGIREGRFDYKFEVPLPDFGGRVMLMRRALTARLQHATVDDFALQRLAKRWEGFSPARIRRVADEALTISKDKPGVRYGYDTWARALRRVQGSFGDVVPESVPPLSALVLSPHVDNPLRALAQRMRNLDEVERRGGSLPRGVLLAGPPGTGKTLAAMSLARTCGWAFVQGSGATLQDIDAIAELVRRARDLRPTIIFLDEADELLAERTGSFNVARTNALLTAIDGAGSHIGDLLWIAATNFPQALDLAALRGGRFEETISFTVFDRPTLARFVANWVRRSPARFASELDPASVAELMGSQTPANATTILQQAVNLMIARTAALERACVTRTDLLMACEHTRRTDANSANPLWPRVSRHLS